MWLWGLEGKLEGMFLFWNIICFEEKNKNGK